MKKLLIPLAALMAIPTAFISVALGANWIATCNTSHSNNDDPIVFPAQPGASHRHVYVGARSANAFSTPTSLRAGGATCGMPSDTSAYWVPQALRYNFGTSKHALFYYKGNASTRPFPDGLKIMVGNAKATSPSQNPGIASSRIKFKCGPGSGTELAAPPAQCGSGIMVPVVQFPTAGTGAISIRPTTSRTWPTAGTGVPSRTRCRFPVSSRTSATRLGPAPSTSRSPRGRTTPSTWTSSTSGCRPRFSLSSTSA